MSKRFGNTSLLTCVPKACSLSKSYPKQCRKIEINSTNKHELFRTEESLALFCHSKTNSAALYSSPLHYCCKISYSPCNCKTISVIPESTMPLNFINQMSSSEHPNFAQRLPNFCIAKTAVAVCQLLLMRYSQAIPQSCYHILPASTA